MFRRPSPALLLLAPMLAGCLPPGVAELLSPSAAEGAAEISGGEGAVGQGPYEMRGFSFVEDTMAGMPKPGGSAPLAADLDFLFDEGVTLLVSLTEEGTPPAAAADAGLALLHLPIADFQPPALAQQEAFVASARAELDAGGVVGVHCTAGLGRTGTMLATWFVAQGQEPEAAIDAIRALRPGSIETSEQYQSVFDYAEVGE